MPTNKKRKKKTAAAEAPKPAPASRVPIHRSTKTTMVGIAMALALVGWLIIGPGGEDATIAVTVPTLTASAVQGKQTFDRICKDCHGENTGGSTNGPPLIHPNYRPGHHADGSFRNAIALGVRQHHWKFGPMPPQPNVKPEEIRPLITYIREMQRANGIN